MKSSADNSLLTRLVRFLVAQVPQALSVMVELRVYFECDSYVDKQDLDDVFEAILNDSETYSAEELNLIETAHKDAKKFLISKRKTLKTNSKHLTLEVTEEGKGRAFGDVDGMAKGSVLLDISLERAVAEGELKRHV